MFLQPPQWMVPQTEKGKPTRPTVVGSIPTPSTPFKERNKHANSSAINLSGYSHVKG